MVVSLVCKLVRLGKWVNIDKLLGNTKQENANVSRELKNILDINTTDNQVILPCKFENFKLSSLDSKLPRCTLAIAKKLVRQDCI